MTTEERDVSAWVERPVRHVDVPDHVMVVDSAATDPVTQAYLSSPSIWVNSYLVRVMTAVTQPGHRVLDVGAFTGEFALAAAARGCHVAAIEANRELAELVAASAEANGFDDLHLLNAAAGDRAGTVQFAPNGPWGQVLGPEFMDAGGPPNHVVQVRLDDVVAVLGWESVAFVKIDIEGSEMRALAGAARLLGASDAPALLFESNVAPLMNSDTEPRELLEMVEGFGYTLHRVTPTEIIACDSSSFQPVVVADYLALKGKSPADFGLGTRPPLSASETAQRVREECRLDSAIHRQSMAWQLRFASPELLRQSLVRRTLAELQRDDDEAVRKAAAWYESASPAAARPAAVARTEPPPGDDADGVWAAERALRTGTELRLQVVRRLRRHPAEPAAQVTASDPPESMAWDLVRWLSVNAHRHPRLADVARRLVRLARRRRRRSS